MEAVAILVVNIAFALASWVCIKWWRAAGWAEGWLVGLLSASTMIVTSGFLLSAGHRLADVTAWAALAVLWALVALGVAWRNHLVLFRWSRTALTAFENRLRAVSLRPWRMRLLVLCGCVTALSIGINYVLVLVCEPGTPDAHQYHLARIGHFLQQGHLGYYPAGYWAQTVYPKVATVLQLYAYLAAGRMTCLMQLPQWLAYLTCLAAGYVSCRAIDLPRRAAAFAAGIFALLTICIAEASTAQNDLILSAFAGCALAMLLLWRVRRNGRYLAAAVIALALMAGVKATALLALLPFAVVAFWVWQTRRRPSSRLSRSEWGALLGGLAFALSAILLPSGYAENMIRYRDPFGPSTVRREYTNEGLHAGRIASIAGLNILRYTMESISLEGLYPLPGVEAAQQRLSAAQQGLMTWLRIPLETREGARADFPFSYTHRTQASENTSGWGLFGLLLLWPAVLFALWRRGAARWFGMATVLYLLVLCILVPYDPFHGRFLITAALFALPVIGTVFTRVSTRWGTAWLGTAVAFGCLAGVVSTLFHDSSPLWSYRYQGRMWPSVLQMGSSDMLTRESPTTMLDLFELQVPPRALVATDTARHLPEYLFFGTNFSRRIMALRPFDGPRLPLPPEAEYLIYDKTSPYFSPNGVQLTSEKYPLGALYLRALRGKSLGNGRP